jgi:hypothetical protein
VRSLRPAPSSRPPSTPDNPDDEVTEPATGSPEEPGGDDLPRPPIRELLEWPLPRILLEAVLGSAGGALFSFALPGAGASYLLFAGVGGVAAPVSLLLTPRTGGIPYRAFRYGLAISVVVTLVASFMAGPEAFLLEELLAFGITLFVLGWGAHAVLAGTVDRAFPPPSSPEPREPYRA